MKRLMAATATATLLFAAGASADDVYNAFGGFAPGTQQRSDISFEPAAPVTPMQPGVGDSAKSYGAFKDGDRTLFEWRSANAAGPGSKSANLGQRPDIYGEFGEKF
jgi:hypothetical protein